MALFEQTWTPFTQWWFELRLVEIGPAVMEKKMNMWKVNDSDNDDVDRQQTDSNKKSSCEV